MNYLPHWARNLIVCLILSALIYLGYITFDFAEVLGLKISDLILSGIVIGFITSILFVTFMSILKPALTISPEICYDSDNEIYYFKVINKSILFSADEVSAELSISTKYNVDHGENTNTTILPLKQSFIRSVPGKLFGKENAIYAQLFGTVVDLRLLFDNSDKSSYIKIEVCAKHSFSGFTKVYKEKFRTKNKIKNGNFKYGNYVNIISD